MYDEWQFAFAYFRKLFLRDSAATQHHVLAVGLVFPRI